MKRIAYLLAVLCLAALATAFAACGGDDDGGDSSGDNGAGDGASDQTDGDGEGDGDGDDSELLDLDNEDLEDALDDLLDDEGNIDVENLPFGRASDEAYAVATDACTQWALWDVDEGQASLDDILALANEALEMDDVRDPVLVRLEADLSSLMLALQRGDGSGVINLASSSIDLDCQAI